MPAKLPKGWVKTTLGEVCAPVANIRPEDSPDTEFTYFDIGGIDNQSNRVVETKTFLGRDAPSRARQSVRQNDILFSTVRTYLKKIARIECEYPNPVASTGFTVIRAATGVLPEFLFSQVLSEDFLQPIHALQTGSSYPAVRDKDVFARPIRLAPTSEQERIVAKLDALLSRVAAGEAASRRALTRLQRYRAAVLHAAVTGELTRDWRKTHKPDETGAQLLKRLLHARRTRWEEAELRRLHDAGRPPKDDEWKKRYPEPSLPNIAGLHSLPKSWAWMSVSQAAIEHIKNGVSVKGKDTPPGIASLKLNAMDDRGFDYSQVRYLPLSPKAVEDLWIQEGDFFVSRGNGTLRLVGRGTLARKTTKKVIFPDTMIRIRLARAAPLRTWIATIWPSSLLRKQVESKAKTTAGIYKISQSDLGCFAVPLPSLAEQTQLVREVEHRLSAADRLAATLNRQLDRARATHQSLLREAFAGKLVPQDPKDEPASVLLERIRAAREAEAKKPKPKRMPKTKLTFATWKLFDLIKERFGGKAFTFEALRKEAHPTEYEYDNLRTDLYEMLRPGASGAAPVLQMTFDAKEETMEFKLTKP